MRCEEASELLGIYRDLDDSSPEKLAVDLHIAGCPGCAEEFRLWEESAELIRGFSEAEEEPAERVWVAESLNRQVMDRIYAEQSWYMPAARRTYAFTASFRRKVALMLAGLLAVFGSAFLYTVWNRLTGDDGNMSALMESASAVSGGDGIVTMEVPMASLSDPYVLHVTPVMPEYWVALSLLGVIVMLLILNWFSRVRS